jgi:twitching motility protein PilT
MFPPEEQHAVRQRIADNLYATVSQRLVKKSDGKGRIAVQEIMVNNPGIREAIQVADKTVEIYTYIEKRSNGMQTFDQHLTDLYKKGMVTLEEARSNASKPDDFERNLMFAEE